MNKMKEERTQVEKRFWQTVTKVAMESGFEPGWEYLGYPCARKRVTELMDRFHGDPSFPGFYGVRIPLGRYEGMKLSLLIENQRELVVGLQTEEDDSPEQEGGTLDTIRGLMQSLEGSGRMWNFEAPGWLAWKTTDIRLNFRSLYNKAFLDIMLNKSDSEALYLIGEEISDILEEVGEVVTKKTVEYGTVIN
jgi:hypothetical protein